MGGLLPQEKREIIQRIGNNALAAFIVIMAGLRRSAKLNTYRNDSRLIKRIPDFEVRRCSLRAPGYPVVFTVHLTLAFRHFQAFSGAFSS